MNTANIGKPSVAHYDPTQADSGQPRDGRAISSRAWSPPEMPRVTGLAIPIAVRARWFVSRLWW
jgi:hypothetical protein